MEKPDYKYGDRVELDLHNWGGSEPVGSLMRGTITGKVSENFIDFWIVTFDDFPPAWPYKSISCVHTLLRREGSNEPFACEMVGK